MLFMPPGITMIVKITFILVQASGQVTGQQCMTKACRSRQKGRFRFAKWWSKVRSMFTIIQDMLSILSRIVFLRDHSVFLVEAVKYYV